MNKKRKILVSLLLLLCMAIFGLYKLFENNADLMNVDSSAVSWEGKKKEILEENSKSIAIPGFEAITLKSDEKQQQVNFHNPEVNDCYFKLTLVHPDGSKLWSSDLIEPGKGLYTIDLDKELASGEYPDAVLRYECFTLNDQSPLNGSEIKLKLMVL
jgi:hypothetical protein